MKFNIGDIVCLKSFSRSPRYVVGFDGENVKIVKDLADEAHYVLCKPSQLEKLEEAE